MTPSPLSRVPQSERQQLLDDLNYLNTAEIKAFCKLHSIPYTIAIETKEGGARKTNEDDRKGVILNRIRHFLQTGVVLEQTCFRAAVVCFDPMPREPAPGDRLFYGQYDKNNPTMIALLRDLTQGKFQDGAIARMLAREFWTMGKAPTFEQYASAWLQAVQAHKVPNPEWAFLADRANQRATKDWKNLRAAKASKVIKTLNQIARP